MTELYGTILHIVNCQLKGKMQERNEVSNIDNDSIESDLAVREAIYGPLYNAVLIGMKVLLENTCLSCNCFAGQVNK